MNTAIANNREPMRREDGDNDTPDLQGQSAGIGFAVPIETIEAIADQLISYERVLRGYLGVGAARWDQDIARILDAQGMSRYEVVIGRVEEGQPAARAGMMPGDVIISVDGRDTPTWDVLRAVISVRKPGTLVDVKVWRDGEEMVIPVRLGGARDGRDERGRPTLEYIPGSEQRSLDDLQDNEQ